MKHTAKAFPRRLIGRFLEGRHANFEALSERPAKVCPDAQTNDATWRTPPAPLFPLGRAAAEGRRA